MPQATIQIQIRPIDNGYLLSARSVDGKNKRVEQSALNLKELSAQVKSLADQLYVEDKPNES